MILERGALLNGRYRIVEILGQGGMGSVYRAVDENLGVEVAVKDNLFTTEEYARQFRREAIILANLRHPNLPRVTDHFVIAGQSQYLVMDYIEGEDLRQRMERVSILPEEEVIVIGAAVCDALTYLASRKPPIIHRDIKPGNVKITPQGHIFLVDFGLAKTLQGSQATTTGARAMTPGYSPPEQYGTARTDQRSDIFSLGATLYAALTGSTPEDALARAMDQAQLTPIRKYNSRISRRLASVIEKSLEVRPDDRYQTGEEFKQALLSASSGARRKEGDYFVTPPPDEEKPIPSDSDRPPVAPGKPSTPANKERSPQLLPASALLEDMEQFPDLSKKKKKRRLGCWFYLLLLILLAALAGAWIYRYDPGLPSRAYATYWPVISPYIPIANPSAVSSNLSTPTSAQASIAPQPTFTHTPTLTMVPEASPTPTATLQPTHTVAPTETPTLVPTAVGGGQIAFATEADGVKQIFLINSDGTDRRQITSLPEGACQPNWSPDGKRLVFISPCASNTDYYPGSAMYIVNEDGSGLLPLPTLAGGDYDPAWSPDGTKIVFTSLRNSGRPQLYILDLEDNSVTPLSEKYAFDFQASWSPDGKQVIFASTRRQGQQLWLMNADGSDQQQFSEGANFIFTRPSWSPDGKMLIYTQYVSEGSIPRVFISPTSIENFEQFRLSNMPMRDAVYSPDGYWIAFEGWAVGGNHDLYIMTATGVGVTALTNDPQLDFDPVWKPLGK
jgi:serine/threonine protein kinase